MKKTLLSVMVFLALTKVNIAGTVPPEKAKAVAKSFFSNSIQNNDASKNAAQDLQLVYTENLQLSRKAEPAYYIFNNSNGAGFVIVAGDDAVNPIIGYSLENNIDINDLPPNFLSFMEGYKCEIKAAKKNNARATADIKSKWDPSVYSDRGAIPIIAPLTKAVWGQSAPYNDKCPLQDGKRTLTGCVATAMGQIMQYWNYPSKGTGSRNGVNFGNTTYDWANMSTWIDVNSPIAQKNAVSTLLYHCGRSVDMDYGLDGSGASTPKAVYAFKTYFGYDPGLLQSIDKDNYSIDSWKQHLKIQLDNGQPVLYRGKATKVYILGFKGYKDGHAWVCDGYDSYDYFHMNWGWNGAYNGYYRLTDLEPGVDEFQYKNLAVINIVKPNRLKLSAISSSLSIMCSMKYFYCSVTKPAAVTTIKWTVPAGWMVDKKLSTGEPIISGASVIIDPPTNFDAQRSIVIRAVGYTSYGETTAPQYVTVATGKPSFTKAPVLYDIGSANHCFDHPPFSTMQILEAGVWKNFSGCIELFNGAKKTVTVRASNSCGVSGAQTFTLTSPIDPSIVKREKANVEENNELSLILSPNPATDNVYIQTIENIKNIKCFNMFGQLVDVKISDNSFSVSHLQNGMYFLSVTTEDGSVVSKKFIKE